MLELKLTHASKGAPHVEHTEHNPYITIGSIKRASYSENFNEN